jgi:hypothetical protein
MKGNIDGTRRGRRRCKQMLDDVKERGDTGKLKKKHYIVLAGELAFEEAVDLSSDRWRGDE